jgi:hypothetical protein
MFQTTVVENIRRHILRSITFLKNISVYEIMWRNTVTAGQATDDNMAHVTLCSVLMYYFSTELLTLAHARKICTELLVYITRSACDRSVL